jgi:heme transport system substrate-binding protein
MIASACRAFAFSLALFAASVLPQPAFAGSAAKRVVALGGDITEIVYRLGEEGRLVGRDRTSKFPEEAATLPDVGYFRQLGAEGLLSLKPDLILASAIAGPPEVLQQIEATGVPIVRLPETHSGDGLLQKIGAIASALGAKDKGEALATSLRRELSDAAAAVAAMPGRPKILFIIDGGGGAPMAAGRDTAADALIALAGGENVFSAHKGYKAVSLEAAARAAPDAIAMMAHTLQSMGGADSVADHPALRLTPAARAKRIVARDGSYLLSFGPRLPQAILDFAHAIRGDEKS